MPAIRMFITNKVNHLKYTGLLPRHVSAIESGRPLGVHFTKEVQLLKHTVLIGKW